MNRRNNGCENENGLQFENAVCNLTSMSEGSMRAKVCVCCDCFLNWNESKLLSEKMLLKMEDKFKGHCDVIPSLHKYYTAPDCDELDHLLLSPRATFVVGDDDENGGFLSCNDCFSQIQVGKLPMFAIANGKTIGEAPPCLAELNPVELALISKARTEKHIFQYYGGCHQSIRGWHTMYASDINQLNAVMNQLENSGDDNAIATILLGPFTSEQRLKVKQQSQVRRSYIREALEWLQENNTHYSDIDIHAQLQNEVICIDTSGPDVESGCSRVETNFEFTEPSKTNGGVNNQETLRDMTLDRLIQNSEMTPTLVARTSRSQLRDYQGATLLLAYPLQFPYGYGQREIDQHDVEKNKQMKTPRPEEYYQWLLRLSLPNMHRAEFILIIHNMFERNRAVVTSFLRAKTEIGSSSQAELFADMSSEDLQNAARRSNLFDGERTCGQIFLQAMNAVTKGMAHSQGAAVWARSEMFAFCTHFGLPGLFFTVTPDDTCNWRIQIMRHGNLTMPSELNDMEASEVLSKYEVCSETRANFPGLCAYDFANVINLVIRYVIGWNKETNTAENGAFGKISAFYGAVEEQSRKTLHVHFIVWLPSWNELVACLYSEDNAVSSRAATELAKFVDQVSSNHLHGNDIQGNKFDHTCENQNIQLCDIQDLRNLRHKKGQSQHGERTVAYCTSCDAKFNSEALALNVIKGYGFDISDTNLFARLQLFLMHSNAKQRFSLKTCRQQQKYLFILNYVRNLHNSNHNRSCWKKGSSCRFLLPKLPSANPTGVHFHDDLLSSHTQWQGCQISRRLFQVIPKRAHCDAYVNAHHSWTSIVLGCNTNIQIGLGGKHIMYCTLYTGKSTEKEDSERYLRVTKSLVPLIRRQELEQDQNNDIPATPFQIGYRRLLGAVLANSAAHVISGPLAAFIVKQKSRFVKSHESVTMPIPAFFKKQVDVKLEYRGKRSYFNNLLFNYQYRPSSLEDLCVYEFFQKYEMKRLTKKDPNILKFKPQHPGRNFDGIIKRPVDVIPIIGFSNFVNASKFNGYSILDKDLLVAGIAPSVIDTMTEYAKQVLTFFVPWREQRILDWSNNEVLLHFQNVCQTMKLKQVHQTMLQNVQDCYDSLTSDIPPDPLEACTKNEISNDESLMDQQREDMEQFLAEEMTEIASLLSDTLFPDLSNQTEEYCTGSVTLETLRGQGTNSCGYSLLHNPKLIVFQNDFILFNEEKDVSPSVTAGSIQSCHPYLQDTLTHKRLFEIVFRSSSRNVGVVEENLHDIDANGSIASITAWANCAFYNPEHGQIDKDQKRAFEVIISSFLLTYLEEADQNLETFGPTLHRSYRSQHLEWKQKLVMLRGIGNKSQLISFLSGPGGSGKSHVVSTVLKYAKAFTKLLQSPFTKRTIVVTAMTGVAATSIRGETIHSAASLFSEKEVTVEQIKEWSDTRLLILDEISFAGKAILIKLNERLCELKENPMARYGGINMVFAGDFSQLEPVSGEPLYVSTGFQQWHDWINCYIELRGNHRFAKDPEYGQIMARFREGKVTMSDIQKINTRVVATPLDGRADLPIDMSYATYLNKDKEAINGGIFYNHLSETHSKDPKVVPPLHTLIIKADDMKWRPSKISKKKVLPMSLRFQHLFFSECASNDVQSTGQYTKRHVDPFLKLYAGIPLMFTLNTDVPNGIANGTLCYLQSVSLKTHMTGIALPTCLVDGYIVNIVAANDVEYLLCKHEKNDITFKVKVESNTNVRSRIPLSKMLQIPSNHLIKQRTPVSISLTQFPVLVNHACTGHKLQGQTKQNLFVSSWSYTKNWPYVLLSRVTSLLGLFMRHPLELDPTKYGMSGLLVSMIRHFKRRTPHDVE